MSWRNRYWASQQTFRRFAACRGAKTERWHTVLEDHKWKHRSRHAVIQPLTGIATLATHSLPAQFELCRCSLQSKNEITQSFFTTEAQRTGKPLSPRVSLCVRGQKKTPPVFGGMASESYDRSP